MGNTSHHSENHISQDRSGLAGQILVASPYLQNPYFTRSVILLLEHHGEGAAGLVLNRTSGQSIRQLWQQVNRDAPPVEQPFHLGGPLPGPLVALHSQPQLGEYQLRGDLFIATDRTRLEQLLHSTDKPFRMFVGHAGWGAGQLEQELRAGAWMVLPLGNLEVFGDEAQLWIESIRRVGQGVLDLIVPPHRRAADVESN